MVRNQKNTGDKKDNIEQKHITPDSTSDSAADKRKQMLLMQEKLKGILAKQKQIKEQQASKETNWKDTIVTYFKQFVSYIHGVALYIGDGIQNIINYITRSPKEVEKGKDPSYLVKAAEVFGGDHDDATSDNMKFRRTKYPMTAGPINFGFIIIFIFIGIGGIWATFAPIASASAADGSIVAPYEKALQNTISGSLEIKKIYVDEGQRLSKGDKIAKLDSFTVETEIKRHIYKAVKYKCMQHRLNKILESINLGEKVALNYGDDFFAEFVKLDSFIKKHQDVFVNYIDMINDLNIKKDIFINDNMNLFNEGFNHFNSIRSLHEGKMESNNIQLKHQLAMYDLLKSELDKQEKLFKGRKKLNSNLAEQTKYELMYHETLKKFKEVSMQIDALKISIVSEQNDYSRQISEIVNRLMDSLLETKLKLDDILPELNKNIKFLKDTLIYAPYDSIVVAKKFKEGSMTQQNDAEIVEIIPADVHDNHIISAKVKAQDILAIKDGAKVEIRFAALESSGKGSPNFNGKVLSVSKNTVFEHTTNRDMNGKVIPGGATMQQPYYLVKVQLDKEEVENYVKKYDLKGLFPIAGMQVSLQIEIGSKTFLQYMITPLTKAWRTAMAGSV